MAGKSNTEKKLTLHEGSKTRRVNLKINYEQLYRYVHNNLDIVSDELKQIKDIAETLKNQGKTLSDVKITELKKLKDSIYEQKNAKLKAAVIDEGILAKFFEAVVNVDKDLYFVAAILHDKDVFINDFWTTEPETDHIHIVIVGAMLASGERKKFFVNEMLEMLRIKFDKEADKSVIEYGAIEVCKSVEDSVKYLTHSTPASESDGKYPYDHNEVYTNDRNQYNDFVASVKQASAKARLKAEDAIAYVSLFREAGLKLMSFRDAFRFAGLSDWLWYYCQGKNAVLNVFKKAYEEGLDATIANNKVDRICLYIYGAPEIGKTTAVEHLCEALGITRDKIFIAAEGYGKYDGLTPQHEVLLADDVSLQNMLTLADERVAKLSQRNKGYAVFAGSLVIATSNQFPDKFFHRYLTDGHGRDIQTETGKPIENDQYEARISRFAIIRANTDGSLTLERPIARGTRTDAAFEKKAIVQNLIDIMQESTKKYCSNIKMSVEELNLYPSREVAIDCKLDPDFKSFVISHKSVFGCNADLYYEAYKDNTPAFLGENDIESVLFPDGSIIEC